MVSRDRLVVDTIDLYRALTPGHITKSALNGVHATMTSKITARLCRANKLSQQVFHSPGGKRWCYYQPAGTKPLGPDALARALCVANLCIYGDTPKLSAATMRKDFPFMPTKGHDYCSAAEGLCLLKVDCGISDADRIVRRLRDYHKSLIHLEGYRSLIQTGRFCARVITPSDSRADQLYRYLEMSPPAFKVIPVIDEELLELT